MTALGFGVQGPTYLHHKVLGPTSERAQFAVPILRALRRIAIVLCVPCQQ